MITTLVDNRHAISFLAVVCDQAGRHCCQYVGIPMPRQFDSESVLVDLAEFARVAGWSMGQNFHLCPDHRQPYRPQVGAVIQRK